MEDPYPVRKELEEEYYNLLLQSTFYLRTGNERNDFNSQRITLVNKIRDERNDQVFDLFSHSQFMFNFCFLMLEKVEHEMNKILILYCFEHRGINTVDLTFFPYFLINLHF